MATDGCQFQSCCFLPILRLCSLRWQNEEILRRGKEHEVGLCTVFIRGSDLLLLLATITKMREEFLPGDCTTIGLRLWPLVYFYSLICFPETFGSVWFPMQEWQLGSHDLKWSPGSFSLFLGPASDSSITPLSPVSPDLFHSTGTSQHSLCIPPTLHWRPFVWTLDLVSFFISSSSAISSTKPC